MWTGLPYPGTVFSGREVADACFLKAYMSLVRQRRCSIGLMSSAVTIHSSTLRSTCRYGDLRHTPQELRLRICPSGSYGDASSRGVAHDGVAKSQHSCGQQAEPADHTRPRLFESEEFAWCLDRSVSEYYWYLAGSFVRGRDRAFGNITRARFKRRAWVSVGVGLPRPL